MSHSVEVSTDSDSGTNASDLPDLQDEQEEEVFYDPELEQSTTSSTMSTPPMVQIGSLSIEINDTENAINETEEVLYPKESRENMAAEKLADLFEKATKTKHKKFDFINLTLTDEDKLDDTYNLDMLVRKMRNAHYNYDLHNVFTILIFAQGDTTRKSPTGTKDLYTEFSEITVNEVKFSNEFYNKWAKAFYFKQNLKLTYSYFQQNVSEELWEKTFESYDDYEPQYKGGPLFFILMINKLLSNTEEATVTLQTRIRNFNITHLKGEDITRAVSLLKGAIRRLAHIKRKKQGSDHEWYDEMTRQVLKIMQTSSVDDFNDIFKEIERNRLIDTAFLDKGDKSLASRLSYEKIFSLAEQQYISMNEAGTWTGVTTKGTESVFKSELQPEQKKIECFNCGGPHLLKDCTRPRDENKIKENRKKKRAAKSESKKKEGGKGRWSNPRPEEHGRRTVNGKLYYFHHKSKRWKLVDNGEEKTANVVKEPTETAPATNTQSSTEQTELSMLAEERRNLENAKKTARTTLEGLLASF